MSRGYCNIRAGCLTSAAPDEPRRGARVVRGAIQRGSRVSADRKAVVVIDLRKQTMASSSAMRKVPRARESSQSEDLPPLSRSQIREITRRARDLEDRTRSLLVSAFSRTFALYYDVSSDTFVMNDPSLGTLFKRQSAARAIQRLLQNHVQIARCRVDRRNRLIESSVPRLRPSWRRRLRHRRKRASAHA